MSRNITRIVVGIFALILAVSYVVVLNLPFLPGPQSLYDFSHFVYNWLSVVSLLSLVTLPVGVIWLILRAVRGRKSVVVPVILIAVSALAFFNMRFIQDWFRDYARSGTIVEAGTLINAVESYYTTHGIYPDEFDDLVPNQLNGIPRPSAMGSREFVYRKTDSAYQIEFYQNVIMNFNIEVVIYDPTGGQVGYGEMPWLIETGHDNWKYFIID